MGRLMATFIHSFIADKGDLLQNGGLYIYEFINGLKLDFIHSCQLLLNM